jgi:hypothetical protein
MRASAAVLLVVAVAACPGVRAQAPGGPVRMAGPLIERFSDEDSRFTVLGYRRTELRGSGRGVDAVIGVVPSALLALSLVVQGDVALVQAVRAGPVTVLLKGGVSTFVALERALEFYPGLQAGLALLVPIEARLALRVDITRHLYRTPEEPYRFWSLGLSLPAFSLR